MTEVDQVGTATTTAPAGTDDSQQDARSIRLVAELVAEPGADRVLDELVGRALRAVDDPVSAMRDLVDDVARLLRDRDAATLFVTLLAFSDDDPYVADLLELLPDGGQRSALAGHLSRLAARWGRSVRVFYDLTTRDPHDWKYVDTRTLYELDRQQWNIEVVVETFGQDEFKLVGPALSYLRLVNRLLDPVITMHEVGGADLSDELDQDAISTFLDLSGRMADLISAVLNAPPGPPEPTDGRGDIGAGDSS